MELLSESSQKDSPAKSVSWRKELSIACLVALVPITIVSAYLSASDSFDLVEDDGISLTQPLLTDGLRQIQSGHLPLWSHHTGCGLPLLARAGGQGLLYPGHYLSHALCWLLGLPAHEVMMSELLHMGFGALTAYLFLRRVGVTTGAAAVGAMGYGLNGPLVGLITNHPDYAFWLPYLPLLLLVIEELLQGNRSWFWPCLGGLIGTFVCLASGPVGAFKLAVFSGLYFLMRANRRHLLFSLVRLGVAGVLALLGSLGQMFATQQWLDQTDRMQTAGFSLYEALGRLACSPEFYRGFVYPFGDYRWPEGDCFDQVFFEEGMGRFPGVGVFVGPLAALALCVAVAYLRKPGLHRALLGLMGVYFLLSLGHNWDGNFLIVQLPFFHHYRWCARWTPEFCSSAALLTGVGLDLGWRYHERRRTRWALLAFLVLSALAVTMRTQNYVADQLSEALLPIWMLMAIVLVYLFFKGRQREFYVLAVVVTALALAAAAPGGQKQRWAVLKYLQDDPLPIGKDTQERVLFLANHLEQRGFVPRDLGPLGKRGEGNFAYNLPHLNDTRTVFGYGPFTLQSQAWRAGVNTMGEVSIDPQHEAETAAIRAFLEGNLLETLRVGYVVVPRYNERLTAACRKHPHLELAGEYTWYIVYRHTGFREPAFFVQSIRPEATLSSWNDLGQAKLAEVCYSEPGYAGPESFSGVGTVRNFEEQHGRIALDVSVDVPQFLVVTSTYYQGWEARVDGELVPLYRVNGSFMGLSIPPGEHRVQLEFRPHRLYLLLGFSLVMQIILVAGCVVGIVARLRGGEPASNLSG
jgi:hypothetical protein